MIYQEERPRYTDVYFAVSVDCGNFSVVSAAQSGGRAVVL